MGIKQPRLVPEPFIPVLPNTWPRGEGEREQQASGWEWGCWERGVVVLNAPLMGRTLPQRVREKMHSGVATAQSPQPLAISSSESQTLGPQAQGRPMLWVLPTSYRVLRDPSCPVLPCQFSRPRPAVHWCWPVPEGDCQDLTHIHSHTATCKSHGLYDYSVDLAAFSWTTVEMLLSSRHAHTAYTHTHIYINARTSIHTQYLRVCTQKHVHTNTLMSRRETPGRVVTDEVAPGAATRV